MIAGPTDPYTEAGVAAGAHALHIGGGHSQGDAGRQQREYEDRRQQLNQQNQDLQTTNPELWRALNVQFNAGNASTDQLIARYGAVNQAGNSDTGQYVRQLYGDQDRLGQTAYDEMASQLGRAPTSSEFNQLYQAFQGPNGVVNGRAAVSQYFQQLQKDPSNPLSPLNPQNSNYSKTLTPYTDSVSQQFKTLLGRDATKDELNHFGSLLASGQTDAYGLGAFLKTMPEYTNAQDAQFRTGLNDTLTQYDTTEFNREKGGVMADYAKRGMQPGNSPSLDYALTDLMGKIASNRSAYLANLSASQYGGNKDLATSGYRTSLDEMYQNNQQDRQRQQGMSDYYTQRGNQGADYYTQMNDYMRFMNQNRTRGMNPLYGAVGGLVGLPGGPAGVAAGTAAGNAFGYLNQ